MNQIRFCEFVNFVCTTVPSEYHEEIKNEGVKICEELFNKKKKCNEMAESKREEIMEEIRRSFTLPTEKNIISFKPKDSDFLTSNCCESVLKKLAEKEKTLANRSLRTSIYIGHAFHRLKLLKSLKVSKLSQYAKENCKLTFSQSYIYFCLKLYKLSLHFPRIYNCCLSVFFVKKHFCLFEDFLDERKQNKQCLEEPPPKTGVSQEFEEMNI